MTSLRLAASENRFDDKGRLNRLALETGWLDLLARVQIPGRGWSKLHTFDNAKPAISTDANGVKTIRARLGDGNAVDIDVVKTVTESAGGLKLELKASALRDSDIEGVLFWIDLPSEIFAGGTFDSEGKDGAWGQLPALYDKRILSSGLLDNVRFSNKDKSLRFEAKFDKAVNVTVQDGREWSKHFSLLIYVHQGAMLKNESAFLNVTLSTGGKADQSPAEFKLDAAKPRYMITGLGGNYCFNLESPDKDYTLLLLKPQFVRTEISLDAWMPSPGAAPDPNAGKVRREFDLLREIAAKKIPYIASVWRAPEWMRVAHDKGAKPGPGVLAPEHLDDVVEAVGTYLLHAKKFCNAEPDYFSFNEPDYGAETKFTAAEHRDAIKRFGAHFAKLGLKAKLLLGDVSNPRASQAYLQPTLDDPEAMKYVGAVSFHSWGGATPEQYAVWPALAEKLKLPLFVGEAGVDPAAWKGSVYKSFEYGLREMGHYQDLFAYARPQAILYWEYTGDYSLLASDAAHKNADGQRAETERFAFQKHWLQFIPPGSEALEHAGAHPFVKLNAFRKVEAGNAQCTFQIGNSAWPRTVRIAGIPADVKSLNVVRTTRGAPFKTLAPIVPVNGVVEFQLAGEGLTTLSTLPVK